MMMPNIYKRGFMDDFFDGFFTSAEKNFEAKKSFGLMRTDIKENEENYELEIDMPGCKKEDVKAQVKDGYLIINATANSENEEKDEEGKFLRRERYSGSMSRSFYVGKGITEEDISAKFENGTLALVIPKEKPAELEEPKYVAIQG